MLGCVPQILILFCAKMQWLSDFMGYNTEPYNARVYPFLMSLKPRHFVSLLLSFFFYFFPPKKIAEFTTVRGHFQDRLVTTKTIREPRSKAITAILQCTLSQQK